MDRLEGFLEAGRHRASRRIRLTGNTLQSSLSCRDEPGQLGACEYRHDRRRDLVHPLLHQSREA